MNQPEPSAEVRPRVMTLPEVAAYLKVSVPTLRNWKAQGKMEMIRLPGGTLRVAIAEVERLAGVAASAEEGPCTERT